MPGWKGRHIKGGVTSQYEYDNAGTLLKDDRAWYDMTRRFIRMRHLNQMWEMRKSQLKVLQYRPQMDKG